MSAAADTSSTVISLADAVRAGSVDDVTTLQRIADLMPDALTHRRAAVHAVAVLAGSLTPVQRERSAGPLSVIASHVQEHELDGDVTPHVRAGLRALAQAGSPVANRSERQGAVYSRLASFASMWASLPGSGSDEAVEMVQRLVDLDRTAVLAGARAAIASPSLEQRAIALTIIGEFDDERSDDLLGALTHPAVEIRIAALHAIGRRSGADGAAFVDAVCARIVDPSADVRSAAVAILRAGDDSRCVDALLLACGDPVDAVRDAARTAVLELLSPDVIAEVVNRLSVADHADVAHDLLVAIGVDATDTLVAAIPAERGSLDDRIAELLRPAAAVGRIRELLRDPDPAWRRQAVRAVGLIRGPDAVVTLFHLLDDPDVEVRTCAATVLGDIGGYGVADQLVLASLSEPVREVSTVMERVAAGLVARIQPGSAAVATQKEDRS